MNMNRPDMTETVKSENYTNKFLQKDSTTTTMEVVTQTNAVKSPQHKPLREEVIRLRQVQNAVDTALRRREQPQAVQRKKHEMEL